MAGERKVKIYESLLWLLFLSSLLVAALPAAKAATIVVFEDGGVAFWDTGGATESNDVTEKMSGVDSYKLILQNGVKFNSVHGMASTDFTTETNVEFWIYGADISDDADVWLRFMNYPQADEYYYTIIILNFTGWKHYSVPRADFLLNYVPSGWNDIEMVEFYSFFAGNSETIRIDLLTITSPTVPSEPSNTSRWIGIAAPHVYAAVTVWSLAMIIGVGAALSKGVDVADLPYLVLMGLGILICLFVALAIMSGFLNL